MRATTPSGIAERLLGLLVAPSDIRSPIDGSLYMRRWRIVQSRWLQLRIHRIVRPDQEGDPHNHPFAFVSLILRGGYIEERLASRYRPRTGQVLHIIERRPGRLNVFPRSDFHRVTHLLAGDSWSVVVGGPRGESGWGYLTRDWQFRSGESLP